MPNFEIIKVFAPAIFTFCVGILLAPLLTNYLYKYKVWKKTPGKIALDGSVAEEFNRLHFTNEKHTPRMGGILVWGSAIVAIIFFYLISKFFTGASELDIDFLSRSQTWIPLFALVGGGIVGFLSDWHDVFGDGKGLRLRTRLLIVAALSTFFGWWFYEKLGVVTIGIPFADPLYLGFFVIPFFVLVSLSVYASGVIDGIDGLAGGVFASIFAAYSGIAFLQNQTDLASFSAMLTGGLLAFLWFNIPPARFYLTETGTMALTLSLAVIAFMTDSLGGGIGIATLPIAAILLASTVVSNVIQVLSKAYFGEKFFRIAPLHHHFEAIGWPREKITMRYWVVSIIAAFVSVAFSVVGK